MPKKKNGKGIDKSIGMFLLTLPIMIILFASFKNYGLNPLHYIISYSISYFLVLYIHELGHLIAGKIAGYKLVSIRIGSLTINRVNNKFKLSVRNSKANVGLCAMAITSKSIFKYLLFVSGGLLANIITGLIALFLSFTYVFGRGFLITYGLISIFIGFANAFTKKQIQDSYSDGAILWYMLRKETCYQSIINVFKYDIRLLNGMRPKESELNITEGTKLSVNDCIKISNKAIDEDNVEVLVKCCVLLENASDKLSAYTLEIVNYIICYAASITNNKEKAKEYYDKIEYYLVKDQNCNGYRVRAYYEYYVNNNSDYAYKLCQKGLDVVDKFIFKGHALMEKDLLEKLQTQILASENGA